MSREVDFSEFGDVEAASLLYASLDEQSQRRDSVIRNINGLAPFAFVRCIDGRKWSEDEVESFLSEEFRNFRRAEIANGRDWLTSGAIACALTHRTNMIGRIIERGKFICEDDVVISRTMVELIALRTIQQHLDVLDGITLLDYRSRTRIVAERKPVAVMGSFSVHRVKPQGVGSAACYFVPRFVAPRIVALQTPLRVPVDHWDLMIAGGAFKSLYAVHPRPARIGDFPTTIGYEYSKKSVLRDRLSRVVALRRLKHAWMNLRGDFNEQITSWVDRIE